MLVFIFDTIEPIQNSSCIFPLVKVKSSDNFLIHSVKYLLTDFSNFRFCKINKSAGWVVSKIWFVVLQRDKGISLSSGSDSVIKV